LVQGIYTLVGKVAGWGGNLTWLSFLVASVTALFTAFRTPNFVLPSLNQVVNMNMQKRHLVKQQASISSVISANG
jgi:hypothetical protein